MLVSCTSQDGVSQVYAATARAIPPSWRTISRIAVRPTRYSRNQCCTFKRSIFSVKFVRKLELFVWFLRNFIFLHSHHLRPSSLILFGNLIIESTANRKWHIYPPDFEL